MKTNTREIVIEMVEIQRGLSVVMGFIKRGLYAYQHERGRCQ